MWTCCIFVAAYVSLLFCCLWCCRCRCAATVVWVAVKMLGAYVAAAGVSRFDVIFSFSS